MDGWDAWLRRRRVIMSQTEEGAWLEREVHECPNVVWWRSPEDGQGRCVSVPGIPYHTS